MATLRALNRRRATVPYEFHCNGGDADQQKAQEKKVSAAEKGVCREREVTVLFEMRRCWEKVRKASRKERNHKLYQVLGGQ